MKPLKSVKLMVATLPLLLLAGCLQDDSSPEACAYDASMALDQGQYDKAISLYETSSCQSALSADEANLNLAAAYIGRAGYDLMDLITDIVNSEDGENALTSAFAANAKASGMNDLEKAKSYYVKMLQTQIDEDPAINTLSEACNSIKTETHSDTRLKRNACFNNGLVASAKAGTSVSMLFGGQENQDDLNAWLSSDSLVGNCTSDLNQNDKVDSADFSSCAITVANSGTAPTNATPTATACSNVTINDVNYETDWSTTITFSDAADAQTYKVIKLAMTSAGSCSTADKTAYRLFITDPDTAISSMALTEGTTETGACTVSGTSPDWLSGAPIPCPVAKEDGTALTMTDTLVDAINNDAETLIQMLPTEDGEDANVSAVDDLKTDICGSATCSVTEADLTAYIQNN